MIINKILSNRVDFPLADFPDIIFPDIIHSTGTDGYNVFFFHLKY